MPHRTVVEFALIFIKNMTSTEDVTHRLFQMVSKTKELNGMPALPNTLRMKGEERTTTNLWFD